MAFVSGRLRDRKSLDRGDPHGYAFYSPHRIRGLSGVGSNAGGGFFDGGSVRQAPTEKRITDTVNRKRNGKVTNLNRVRRHSIF